MQERDIDALLVAALLHDVGHIAFGHFLEEMTGLFRRRTHEDYAIGILEYCLAENDKSGPKFEVNTRRAIKHDSDVLNHLIRADWVRKDGQEIRDFLASVARILKPEPNDRSALDRNAVMQKDQSDALKFQILHSIIDSAIDADKMDYLLRDAHHCGVEYANGIDVDRFFQSLTAFHDLSSLDMKAQSVPVPGRLRVPPQACIGVTHKGILPVESIVLARYQMFRAVYWHRTARAYTAMLQFLIMEYISATGSGIEHRLDTLIKKFRENSDQKALEWLRRQCDNKNLGLSESRRSLLRKVVSVFLGKRNRLYKEIFVIRYETEGSTYNEEGIEIDEKNWTVSEEISVAKNMYLNFMHKSREMNAAARPEEYLNNVRKFRGLAMKILNKRLPGNAKVKYGEMLIDIPPADKDQIENIFVYQDDRPKRIQEISPIAAAVRETFIFWARNVRVFMSPDALDRCRREGVGRDKLRKDIWFVFRDIFELHKAQYALKL